MTDKSTKKTGLYLASLFLPMMLLLLVFALHGIYPFGDATVMTGDMEYQFVDYLAYLKTIVGGNNDFSYSFSKNLGGSMAGFSAYYYYSPLNFITLLFPDSMLPVAESLVILLTAGLSSLSMAVLLVKKYRGNMTSLLFCVSYALCGFSATYFQLTMYSGSLILFPLIILGLMELIEDPEKNLLYIVTLSAAVLFNYYSGYMICIFVFLFYVAETLKRGFNVKAAGSFVISSLLAVCLTAFSLLPAVLSLKGEKNSFSFGFFRTFSVREFPAQFFAGSFKGNVSTGLPNIFCGVVVVALFVAYFIDKKVLLKEKLVTLGLWLFLIINFWINILNIVWHGFNQPIGFPYRYSYMLSFVMILVAHRAFTDLTEDKERETLKKAATVLLTVIALADLSYNYFDVMNYYSLASLSEYRDFLKGTGEKVEECRTDNATDHDDAELYRIEKYYRRTNNDAMQFNYAGLSHFSSSEKKDKINFMGKLGFRNNGNWSFYNESATDFLESFFGVRYILSQFSSTPNKYRKIIKDEEINVFRNDNALPLMFSTTDKIRDINYNGYNGDPFMLQAAIADSLNGRSNGIFERAEILSVETENLTDEADGEFTLYRKKNNEKDAWIDLRVRVPDDKRNLFAYFDAKDNQNAELIKDGVTFGDYFSRYRWNIISFHRTKKAAESTIRIRLIDDELSLGNMYLYYEDRDKVASLMEEVKNCHSSLRKLTSSHLTGNITVPEDKAVVTLTIPYDKGWSVYVDGVKTGAKRAAGLLMSFDAAPGEHSIEMKYLPEGSIAGRIISILALGLLILIGFRRKAVKTHAGKSVPVDDISGSL